MPIRGQVTRAELISTGAGVKGRVLRAELFSQAASETVRGQVLRAELFSQDVAGVVRGRVVRAELFSTGSNATAVSPSGSVPSHSKVTLAAAYNGPDPTPDYEWRQLSGPAVTLTPNDALATCLVTIPALWAPANVVVQVRVLETGGATDWATCTLSAARHEVWQIQTDTAPPPPPPPVVGSGVPMPTGTIVDPTIGQTWVPLTSNDFTTDVALGGFATVTTGSDLGKLDPASPGGAAYATAWKAKQAEFPDTSGFAKYSAAKTMSVSNSILDIWLHTESAQAYGSAMKPLLPQADPNFLGYCRIDFRMRSTGIVGTGFGAVALLINNNQWSQSVEGWGEDDWPEVQLGGPVGGNRHFTHPIGVADTFRHVDGGGLQMTDWHTYSIQWFAQGGIPRVIYKADGVTYFDSTDRVAASPRKLGFLVQTASNGAGAVPSTSEGHLQIDWYSIWTAA